jgi:CheY-like chemotaxis protein/two-component sensor histidine kinase
VLAHELRNPLAPIVNSLGYLGERGTQGEPSKRLVAIAARQARHMARLVDDLVDVSRIRSGKVALQRSHVDVARVVDDAVHALEALMRECRHEFRVSVEARPLVVDGDPVRLAQVLENLLNNAAKYTDPGGHIALEVERDGAEVVMRVRDDGLGIEPELQPVVFDLFVQCDQTAERARGGLGLGLSLVRSLVEMHGGTVSVHSEGPGRGSTFEVRLPAVEDDGKVELSTAHPTSSHADTAAARGLRIVLVEDSDDIRETMRALLELRGHVVLDASDGAAGVALVQQQQPDVALIDIGLPGLDGFGVAAALRANGSSARLIAVSGYGRPEDRARASDAGFDAHLVKPVDPAELDLLLRQLDS